MEDISVDQWRAFFGSARIVLESSRTADRLVRQQAGAAFNTFDWIQPSENNISDILRDLLDPRGSHGQEHVFLELAASEIFVSSASTGANFQNSTTVREAQTHHGRRIDLMIHLGQAVVGIENKPFAGEGQDQLKDYAEYLSERYPERYALIFLHGPGIKATSLGLMLQNHLEQQGRFRLVPYYSRSSPSLHGWLLKCIAACRADKVRWFLVDFADYVEVNFAVPEKVVQNEI